MAAPQPGAEPNSEPLKYQTWVLKVFIHCEGCKKKVKKILHSVYGVYTIDVDSKEQKVTVTGNVDSNILIKKLEKSGKHAELLSPLPTKIPNNNNNNKQSSQQHQKLPQPNSNQKNPTVKTEKPQKNENSQNGGIEISTPNNGNQNPKSNNQQQKQQIKEVKFEPKTPVTGEEKNSPENTASGDFSGKKKKKKKGNNGNNGENEVSPVTVQDTNGGQAISESQPSQVGPGPGPGMGPYHVNMSMPGQNRVCEYPPGYYVPPPPVYGVSYNTVHPSSSYTTSYYYSAPTPYSYAYVRRDADVEQSPPLVWNSYSSRPSDSFEMFNDENPNAACSVM